MNFGNVTDNPARPLTTLKDVTEFSWKPIDDQAVVTARCLAMDSVQKVGNGHPGTAMSLAPVAYLLFQKFLRHDPSDPHWLGRDRFVLSNGHSSLTLYIQLFLSGYGLELNDLETFRTWGSKTPGHPEFGHTAGVELTTGPLGTGPTGPTGTPGPALFTLTTTNSNISFPSKNSINASPDASSTFARTLEAYQTVFLTFYITANDPTTTNNYGLTYYDGDYNNPWHYFYTDNPVNGNYYIFANGVATGVLTGPFLSTTQFTIVVNNSIVYFYICALKSILNTFNFALYYTKFFRP
jgi:hypothetical protein